jgi:hypothetical protein
MSEVSTMMLSLTIYKVITVLAGLGFAFMGYRLFIHGIFTEAGELRTNWENRSLVLRKAAPGTFFALFGAVIACVSLWRGLTFGELGGGANSGIRIETGSGIGSTADVHTSGIASRVVPDKEALGLERLRVREHIAFLNQLLRLVNPALRKAQRQRVREKTRAVKLYLTRAVWHHDWGQFEDFQLWAEGGGKAVDSEAFRRAADFFAYGQEEPQ